MFNFNIGILGHVDAGKTTLAKALSQTASTAAFDKNPQSKQRGITLDLGFSSFVTDVDDELQQRLGIADTQLQITLVDCPGHASLIKTVIGGAQIIDLAILVIDVIKGIQTQTAECMVLAEITCPKHLIIALNKVDLLPEDVRAKKLDVMCKRLRKTLERTSFAQSPIVPVSGSAAEAGDQTFVLPLVQAIKQALYKCDRSKEGGFMLAVDHCFTIKGQGTIMTGTVLRGQKAVNGELYIPVLNESRKIKSMQMFRKPVQSCMQGDRVGVCVANFNASELERGIVCDKQLIEFGYAVVASFNTIDYFKGAIKSRATFHISHGYETTLAKCHFFSCTAQPNTSADAPFDFDTHYEDVTEIESSAAGSQDRRYFVLLEFEHGVQLTKDALYIASRLDADIHANSCRFAFHGRLLHIFTAANYAKSELHRLKVYRCCQKVGVVERVHDEQTLVVHSLFKKETNLAAFLNLRVRLSTGEEGYIESSFGQSGKIKVVGRQPFDQVIARMPISKGKAAKKAAAAADDVSTPSNNESVKVILDFRRYLFDAEKKMIQA